MHLSRRLERADHRRDVLQEISEVDSVAVDGSRQVFVELRGDRNTRVDIIEQCANLLRGEGSAAPGNSLALKANGTAQAGQVVRYPMIGLVRSRDLVVDGD